MQLQCSSLKHYPFTFACSICSSSILFDYFLKFIFSLCYFLYASLSFFSYIFLFNFFIGLHSSIWKISVFSGCCRGNLYETLIPRYLLLDVTLGIEAGYRYAAASAEERLPFIFCFSSWSLFVWFLR